MQNSSQKVKLSKNILEMKFMKKSKEKCEQEAEEAKRRVMFDSELTDSMLKDGDKCVIEPSYIPCQELVFGRFSYRGMNPEIEKLMQEAERKKFQKFKQMDGISNKEMAYRYNTLVGSMEKKFTSKRMWADIDVDGDDNTQVSLYSHKSHPQKNRHKFLKPRDDS